MRLLNTYPLTAINHLMSLSTFRNTDLDGRFRRAQIYSPTPPSSLLMLSQNTTRSC